MNELKTNVLELLSFVVLLYIFVFVTALVCDVLVGVGWVYTSELIALTLGVLNFLGGR